MGKPHPPRRSRQPSEYQQLPLPFSTPEPLRVALASIDRRLVGVKSEHSMRAFREMAMAVWLSSQVNGCRARLSSLIVTANRNADAPVIGSDSKGRRVLRQLEDAGIISSELAWNERGQAGSERALNEQRIHELVQLSRDSTHARRRPKGDRHLTGTCQSPDRHHLRKEASESSESPQSKIKTSSSSSSLPLRSATNTRATPHKGSAALEPNRINAEEEEEEIQRLILDLRTSKQIPTPQKIANAIRNAIRNGCSVVELRARCRWFCDNWRKFNASKLAVILFEGINDATPGLPVDLGWPKWGLAQ